MCYAEASRPKPNDVRSAVGYVQCQMRDLAFDASHEQVYGLGRWNTDEELKKEEKKYDNGVAVCNLFLRNAISRDLLLDLLRGLRLEEFADKVNRFIEKEEAEGKDETD